MTPVATIQKNDREELRVSIDEFKGHHLLNVRVWYDAADGEQRPGKQGIALKLSLLPGLLEALKDVQALAREQNLEEAT